MIAFLVATEILSAQTGTIASREVLRAKQLLDSPVIEDRAWGIYFAARQHSPELDALLLDQFRSVAASEHDLVAVLLDGAIEADLTVPPAMLEPLKDYWTDTVTILLARNRDSDDLLMQLRANQPRDVVWLAANNVLSDRKSQAWFAATVTEIEISHRFLVTDGAKTNTTEGEMGGGVCGDGTVAMPKGFPPVTLYELFDTARAGDVLLAQGPKDVYYRKKLVPSDKQVGLGSCSGILDRNQLNIDYLTRLDGPVAQSSELLFHGNTRVIYSGADDLQRQMDSALMAQESAIREFVQTIARKNGLRMPDVQLSVIPKVEDARETKTEPLPHPAPRQFDLR